MAVKLGKACSDDDYWCYSAEISFASIITWEEDIS